MNRFKALFQLLFCVLLLVACGGADDTLVEGDKESTAIDLGNDPLQKAENACAGPGQAEGVTTSRKEGKDDQGNKVNVASGGGCIERPIKEVWGTLFTEETLKWGKKIESVNMDFSSEQKNSDFSYLVRYEAGGQSWVMDWWHNVEAGTVDDPEGVTINYKRISSSSKAINWWTGTIVLKKKSENVTGFYMENHFNRSAEKTESAIHSMFERMSNNTPNYDLIGDFKPAKEDGTKPTQKSPTDNDKSKSKKNPSTTSEPKVLTQTDDSSTKEQKDENGGEEPSTVSEVPEPFQILNAETATELAKEICTSGQENLNTWGKEVKRSRFKSKASGCLTMPIAEAWSTLFDAETIKLGRLFTVNSLTSVMGVGVDFGFKADYVNQRGPEFPIIWGHQVLKGDVSQPETVLIKYMKNEPGNDKGAKLKKFQGEILLKKISENQTLFMMEHLSVVRHKPDNLTGSVSITFEGIKNGKVDLSVFESEEVEETEDPIEPAPPVEDDQDKEEPVEEEEPEPAPRKILSSPVLYTDVCYKVDGEYTKDVRVISGPIQGKKKAFWGEGGGCIFGKTIEEVFAFMQTKKGLKFSPNADVKKINISSDKGRADVIYSARKVVEWQQTFKYEVEESGEGVISYSKTKDIKKSFLGFVKSWDGRVSLKELEPGVIAVLVRNESHSSSSDLEASKEGVIDAINRINSH